MAKSKAFGAKETKPILLDSKEDCIAHTLRMSDGSTEKKALSWIPKGARRREFLNKEWWSF